MIKSTQILREKKINVSAYECAFVDCEYWRNRLIELIVDDQAIDDTIYHLARGLNNSDVAKIDLEKFLKVKKINFLFSF